MAASGMSSAFGCSSSTISAFAVMLAFSSLPGLSIDTLTSKLVTLSFSTPSGEICVTWPLNVRSLNVSTRMRAGWPSRTRPMSASSTLPRTNTLSMSPSVMTSVAFAPRLRIDDTGLPISTSRLSTVARIGARIVALARSSASRSATALACATCARASVTFASLTASCDCAARLRFSAMSTALCASSSADCAISRSANSICARS